jgi:NAD(P)-dependent dehydrogenase (short-subunit alcohol dehydrogenase family)
MTISSAEGSRTILISGASKGIGRSLAERLAGQGHKVLGAAGPPGATAEIVSVAPYVRGH